MNQFNDIYFERTNIALKLDRNGGFKTDYQGEYQFDCDLNCYFSYQSNQNPPYKTRENGIYKKSNIYKPDEKLSFQIAFLILEKKELKSSPKKNDYLRHLKELNEFRNHLYLTHGEDATNADFSKLYIEQRKLDSDSKKSDEKWQEKIEQLFKIVYFLCTGNECIL